MTTNLVEAVNSVLRRTRHLLIFTIFSTTFYRLATLMPRMGLRQAKQIEARHTLRHPCAYGHATCARANLNVEQFIDEIYTLQRTLRIWGNKFPVMPDVLNWEVPPSTFEMVPDCSLRRHSKDRPQSTRIQNYMDVRETGEPKLCTVCRTSRHNRSTCPHRVYVSSQSSRNAGLQDNE
ncbi:hypothetical protein PVK06_033701 [Gossypium arboreum]|uniref:Uncharacterized protein n=1 Tax=Gossypium arboreum TaxID=29729 RepID=A0ABR0NEA9_GOSAR|nr:hypothetical protein PVK06_033701 [Gossypium arboreum]